MPVTAYLLNPALPVLSGPDISIILECTHLVALGQVRVEVLLAIKLGAACDLAVECETCPDAQCCHLGVHHRQRTLRVVAKGWVGNMMESARSFQCDGR